MRHFRYATLWPLWGLLGFTSACINTRKLGTAYIYPGQQLTRNEYVVAGDASTGSRLVTYTLRQGVEGKIKQQDTSLDITPLQPLTAQVATATPRAVGTEAASPTTRPDYFFDSRPVGEASTGRYVRGKSLKYLEISPAVQATTIPIKVRPGLTNKSAYSASGSFNVGVSYGLKFTHNVYRSYYSVSKSDKDQPVAKDFLNSRTNKFTFMPGLFVGPSLVELTPANTQNAVEKDRTVVGLTTGIVGVVAINQFSLGAAMGWDYGLGSPATQWNYHRKRWYGIVLGLDFIK
ncbi:hypothetical protein [Hymenobacter pini]|uniref:hypothetical protein n=1 Tax=Hymenobacter pini TaxID=2880879 RepID=UPI001CF41F65|nr:hypothetical protein [Hymenobacter pini]MCA8832376.1 hypothetical protein [Hymenobacter pini]